MEGTTPTPSIVVQHRSPECDPTATVQSKMRVAGTCRRGRHHLANIATSPSGTATIDHLSAWWRIMPCSAVCLPTSVASVG